MNEQPLGVVVVDDHPMLRSGVCRVLDATPGFRVVGEASNGTAAMELIRTKQPQLIVVDIHLPGEDGVEISRRVLEEYPAVKVLVLTAETGLSTIRRALQLGVSAYLTKERPGEELIHAIREALDNRVYLSPEIASLVVQDYMNEVVQKSAPPKPELTERDRLLLRLVAEGKRNKEIADDLRVEVKSVETYRSRLMRKLGCASPAELTRYAIREGIIAA